MLRIWQFWVLTSLAALVAALIATNMWAFSANRKLQSEVNARAQYIQQSAQLEQLTRDIATALAQLSARHQDEQIRAMLAGLGFTFAVNTTQSPGTPAGQSAAGQPAAGAKR